MVKVVRELPVKEVRVLNRRFYYLEVGDIRFWVSPNLLQKDSSFLSFPIKGDIYKMSSYCSKISYNLSGCCSDWNIYILEISKDYKVIYRSDLDFVKIIEVDNGNNCLLFIRARKHDEVRFLIGDRHFVFVNNQVEETGFCLPDTQFYAVIERSNEKDEIDKAVETLLSHED
jgi:hypothetical protein